MRLSTPGLAKLEILMSKKFMNANTIYGASARIWRGFAIHASGSVTVVTTV